MPTPPLHELLRDHVLLFPPPPAPSSQPRRSAASQSLGFRTRPTVERHVRQNHTLWRSVQDASLPSSPAPPLALALPSALHAWLSAHSWSEAAHAVLCILHDATCAAPEWRTPASYPARLAPSVALALGALRPHPAHCPQVEMAAHAGRRGRRLPLVTPASRGLDDLLQSLAGERLWTVPVYVVVDRGDADTVAFVRGLLPQWWRYRGLAVRKEGGLSEVSKRFMEIVRDGALPRLWRQVDAVCDMGGVRGGVVPRVGRKKKSVSRDVCRVRADGRRGGVMKRVRKGNTFFACLPEELLTEHIIPSLCLRPAGAEPMLQSPSDEET